MTGTDAARDTWPAGAYDGSVLAPLWLDTPDPDHVPRASSSRAMTGLIAVCQTTHWWPYSRIVHSLSTTW